METTLKHGRFSGYAILTATILGIAFSAFLSIFSLDAFSKDYSFGENAFSLFVHLLPVFAVFGTVWIARKKPLVGVIVYAALGIAYIIWAWGRFPLSVYFLIAGPLFLLSLLFYLGSRK